MRLDHEIDRLIGAPAAIKWLLYRSVMMELSHKANLLISWSVYILTLTHGMELWVMTERTRNQIQVADVSFLHRVAGHSLRDRVRNSLTRKELRVEPLLPLIKKGCFR